MQVFSNLFAERFIDQVQVVAYFHEWTDAAVRGGNFKYFHDSATPAEMLALPRSGSVIDGSKSVHAADVYLANDIPPQLDKSKVNVLKYAGGVSWKLMSGDHTIRTYNASELRWTVVYRARCFEDPSARDLYHNNTERLSLDDVLNVFASDLLRRGLVSSINATLTMPRLELAVLLLDTYIKYPLSTAASVPYNYCALGKLVPWLAPMLSIFCK